MPGSRKKKKMTESFLLLGSLGIHFFSAQSWTILLRSQSRGERVLDKANILTRGKQRKVAAKDIHLESLPLLAWKSSGIKMDVIIGASW